MGTQIIADKRRLSHAYILIAPHREESLDMARNMAAAALCEAEGALPCGVCRHCRKLAQDIHPDVTYVRRLPDDKGREKKEIVVDQVRLMIRDAFILPNEAARKVFIVDEADRMNAAAQNAALKLLEEPPRWLTLILCARNANAFLSTVRSRCVEISAVSAETAEDESYRLAQEYLRLYLAGRDWELCRFCFAQEGMDAASASAFVQALRRAATDIICGRKKAEGFSRAKLMGICALAERCEDYLMLNTGVKHIFGLLAALPSADDK